MSNIIRLTPPRKNLTGLALFDHVVNTKSGVSVEFDLYMYGGSGGDGVAFSVLDAAEVPNTAGGEGGSLGYARRFATPGLVGGYMGVGFDAFGTFSVSSRKEGHIGGPGFIGDAIAVRGKVAKNSPYLTGLDTPLTFSLDLPNKSNPKQAKQSVRIELSKRGKLNVQIDVNKDGDFADKNETIIRKFNVTRVNGKLPETAFLAFTGATAVATNTHEIGNISVRDERGKRVVGEFRQDRLIVGTKGNDRIKTASGGSTVDGAKGNDRLQGQEASDVLIAGDGKDTLLGAGGDDILVSGLGADKLTSGSGVDRFVFSGRNQAAALSTSRIQRDSVDVITDFLQIQGDRLQLDFDNKIGTTKRNEYPKKLFNAGVQSGKSLESAVKSAFEDPSGTGKKALGANEAVFFEFSRRIYIAVNDGGTSFSAKKDLVANLGKFQENFVPNAFPGGALNVKDFFA